MAKGANISNEIFDYIHVSKYKNLFSLAWYADLTYADEVIFDTSIFQKLLPKVYYHRPNCNSF